MHSPEVVFRSVLILNGNITIIRFVIVADDYTHNGSAVYFPTVSESSQIHKKHIPPYSADVFMFFMPIAYSVAMSS